MAKRRNFQVPKIFMKFDLEHPNRGRKDSRGRLTSDIFD